VLLLGLFGEAARSRVCTCGHDGQIGPVRVIACASSSAMRSPIWFEHRLSDGGCLLDLADTGAVHPGVRAAALLDGGRRLLPAASIEPLLISPGRSSSRSFTKQLRVRALHKSDLDPAALVCVAKIEVEAPRRVVEIELVDLPQGTGLERGGGFGLPRGECSPSRTLTARPQPQERPPTRTHTEASALGARGYARGWAVDPARSSLGCGSSERATCHPSRVRFRCACANSLPGSSESVTRMLLCYASDGNCQLAEEAILPMNAARVNFASCLYESRPRVAQVPFDAEAAGTTTSVSSPVSSPRPHSRHRRLDDPRLRPFALEEVRRTVLRL
jgi:hypothetical protein